jgi:hypothetical protein
MRAMTQTSALVEEISREASFTVATRTLPTPHGTRKTVRRVGKGIEALHTLAQCSEQSGIAQTSEAFSSFAACGAGGVAGLTIGCIRVREEAVFAETVGGT